MRRDLVFETSTRTNIFYGPENPSLIDEHRYPMHAMHPLMMFTIRSISSLDQNPVCRHADSRHFQLLAEFPGCASSQAKKRASSMRTRLPTRTSAASRPLPETSPRLVWRVRDRNIKCRKLPCEKAGCLSLNCLTVSNVRGLSKNLTSVIHVFSVS